MCVVNVTILYSIDGLLKPLFEENQGSAIISHILIQVGLIKVHTYILFYIVP